MPSLLRPTFLSGVILLIIVSGGGYYLSGGGIKYMNWRDSLISEATVKRNLVSDKFTYKELDGYIMSVRYHLIYNRKDILLWEMLGKLSLNNNDIETALISFNQAYIISGRYSHKVLYIRALIEKNTYESLGKAQGLLEDMLIDFPEDMQLNEMLSVCFVLQKKYSSAVLVWNNMMGMLDVNDYRYNLLKNRLQNFNKNIN
ncbi:hypothetical protein Q4S30_19025 [Morganella morganii]